RAVARCVHLLDATTDQDSQQGTDDAYDDRAHLQSPSVLEADAGRPPAVGLVSVSNDGRVTPIACASRKRHGSTSTVSARRSWAVGARSAQRSGPSVASGGRTARCGLIYPATAGTWPRSPWNATGSLAGGGSGRAQHGWPSRQLALRAATRK